MISSRISPRQDIVALLPIYSPQGDSCQILSTDGNSQAVSKRLRTVLQQLLRHQAIDPAELRRQSSAITGGRLQQPLALSPELILIPFKVRSPRVSGDSTIGYINLYAVASVKKQAAFPYRSLILLHNGGQLPSMWSAKKMQQALAMGKLVASETTAWRNARADCPANDNWQQQCINIINSSLRLLLHKK